MKAAAIAALCSLVACASVLGLTKSETTAFPHRKHVLAGVTCTKCHQGVDKDGPALHVPDDQSCLTCHAKPHDTRSCLGCHTTPGAIDQLVEAREHLVFSHGKHMDKVNGNCMRCHTGVADGDEHMRPQMSTCFRCHDQDASRDARKCDACHKNLEETGMLPATHLAHDGDWLREHGTRSPSANDVCESCHKASFCASCHGATVPALPAARKFADPFAASVHRAGFVSRHSLEAKSQPGACQSCHTPDRCVTCHTRKDVAGPSVGSPHPPGWVGLTSSENLHGREARRDPVSCAGCHSGAGEQLCVQCHAVGGVGGNPHPPGWSSKQPMSAMPCRMCHPIGSR